MRNLHFMACVSVAFLLSAMQVSAQSFEEYKKQTMENYRNYVKEKMTAFESYRAERNKQFADYIKQRWQQYDSRPAVEPPARPKPVVPDKKDDDPLPATLPVIDVKPIARPSKPVAVTVTPVPRNIKPADLLSVPFYGATCRLRFDKDKAFALRGVDEEAVSSVWTQLVNDDYSRLLDDCIAYRSEWKLCDWAYFLLTRSVAKEIYRGDYGNEAALLHAFLLMQSGYDVKVVRLGDSRLLVAFSTEGQVYGFTFFVNDGRRYYLFADNVQKQPIYTYAAMFYDKARPCVMGVPQEISLPFAPADAVVRTSKHYGNISVTTRANKNLMAFYNDHPQCVWTVYARSPMTARMRADVLPVLKNAIKGKGEVEAANILLDFVQTAFAYKTDEQQFGYERPLFVDEVFYYPYCDCEDRAIFYAYLVHELLGLDVALLYYPMHLAAAVAFDSGVDGDNVMIDGRKYLVCDPTIVSGASVGEAMKRYKNTQATAYLVEY